MVQLTQGDPYAAVCSRGDLATEHPLAKGCFDSKVTSSRLARQRAAWVVNGPTHNAYIQPFAWSEEFRNTPHRGQAAVFNFSWELQVPDRALTAL